jgi:hypothetical protein
MKRIQGRKVFFKVLKLSLEKFAGSEGSFGFCASPHLPYIAGHSTLPPMYSTPQKRSHILR